MDEFECNLYKYDIPILNIEDRIGYTQYIDFIKWDEFTNPIIKGYDIFGRKFVVIKMIINDIKIMQTFFQRHSFGRLWMGCGHATVNLIDTSSGMSNEQFNLISQIINKEKVKIRSEHRPVLDSFIDNYVVLYNEIKWNAAIKIQKAWRTCRWNPEYIMCANISLKKINNIRKNDLY